MALSKAQSASAIIIPTLLLIFRLGAVSVVRRMVPILALASRSFSLNALTRSILSVGGACGFVNERVTGLLALALD